MMIIEARLVIACSGVQTVVTYTIEAAFGPKNVHSAYISKFCNGLKKELLPLGPSIQFLLHFPPPETDIFKILDFYE